MATVDKIVPFIRKKEGGLSFDTNDKASKNPCPYAYYGKQGCHTSNGWTWEEWSSVRGVTPDSATEWYQLSIPSYYDQTNSIWTELFKKYYWDLIQGDFIISQRIANAIVDWLFNSGKWAEINTQKLLDALFNDHLTIDGCFGSLTINAINSADEPTLYADIIEKRKQFYQIAATNPGQSKYLDGWLKRVDDLTAYNQTS